MSRKLWRRPVALGAATLVAALCTACATTSEPTATDRKVAVTPAEQVFPDSSECGSGGDGGDGGDSGEGGRPGEPGEPGEPGTRECTRYSDLPDKPKEELTLADKVRVVLVLLNGGASEAQIARKYDMPKDEVAAWKEAYIERDWSVLMDA
ncbi:hypothetical protein [Streptomyces sp. TRM70350]|uniref:hypothetical protein n=1 Tax=Streptomyces sp. TRM70350 TaxID=2856165 RepID=UPI001C47701A|nr:hypothetical protein [Streptomyces sp. TRM70350]MBV7697256.1 hypothetical protein [Streptomyces sp. TRM70350]